MKVRFIKVFDILCLALILLFLAYFFLEKLNSPITAKFEDYIVLIISPNIWWLVRYIVCGEFFPSIPSNSSDPNSVISSSEVRHSEEIERVSVDDGERGATTLKYIFVWILVSFLNTIASSSIAIIARMNVSSFRSDFEFLFFSQFFFWATGWVITVLIYDLFKSLDIKKVLPFFYISTAIGVVYNLSVIQQPWFSRLDVSPWGYFISTIALAAVFIYALIKFFRFRERLS